MPGTADLLLSCRYKSDFLCVSYNGKRRTVQKVLNKLLQTFRRLIGFAERKLM